MFFWLSAMGRRGVQRHRNTEPDHCAETRSLKEGNRDGQQIGRPEQGGHDQKRQGAEDRRAHPISRCQVGSGAGLVKAKLDGSVYGLPYAKALAA